MAFLIFAYNADSGLFNAVTDLAHKVFSPQTYQCNLCALTHSTFGMRRDWRVFLEALDMEFEFLHADELKSRDGISGVPDRRHGSLSSIETARSLTRRHFMPGDSEFDPLNELSLTREAQGSVDVRSKP